MDQLIAALKKVIAKKHTKEIDEAFTTIRVNWADYSGFRKPSEANEKEFKKEFESIDTIYRCITSDGKEGYLHENLKKRGTGIYWTWDLDSAICYWGGDHEYRAILTAKIDGSEVDWLATLEQYLKPQYAGEDEVRLKDKSTITITNIELQNKEGEFVDAIYEPFKTKVTNQSD